ncbi:MAG: hypothetical protein HY822_15320 [Acidobacteria bacterium]|nr:hypothetical protein [Acidobacteriota bacterium]
MERVRCQPVVAPEQQPPPALFHGQRHRWNGSVQREFKLRESVALRFRLDLMNPQNRSMFAAPNTNPISTDFGKVTATSSRGSSNRWIQIQARLQF